MVLARRRAFVVHAKRAAAVGHRAVVIDVHALRRHLSTELRRADRSLLADPIALEAVAEALVRQHAAPARRDHDGVRASPRLHCREQLYGHPGGLAREALGRSGAIEAGLDRATRAREAGLPRGAIHRERNEDEP